MKEAVGREGSNFNTFSKAHVHSINLILFTDTKNLKEKSIINQNSFPPIKNNIELDSKFPIMAFLQKFLSLFLTGLKRTASLGWIYLLLKKSTLLIISFENKKNYIRYKKNKLSQAQNHKLVFSKECLIQQFSKVC